MVKKEQIEEEYEDNVSQTLKELKPLAEVLAPKYIEYHKTIEPRIRRAQYINFIIMSGIVLSLSLLTWKGFIEGNAVVGIFGAIAGYVFGGIYDQRRK